MGTFKTSQGLRFTTIQIDRLVRKAKKEKIDQMNIDHGYIFCESCLKSNNSRFDCSHQISVKESKENGSCEFAWDVNNIKILCRECHQKLDGLNLKFKN